MKGILTNCHSGKESEIELEYSIETREDQTYGNRKVFVLLNGVTGWESFIIDSRTDLKRMSEHGWMACLGTKDRWDRLFIPADEMKKVLEKGGLI